MLAIWQIQSTLVNNFYEHYSEEITFNEKRIFFQHDLQNGYISGTTSTKLKKKGCGDGIEIFVITHYNLYGLEAKYWSTHVPVGQLLRLAPFGEKA